MSSPKHTMDTLRSMQDNLCKSLSSDPHIIEQCQEILTLKQFRALEKLSNAKEKITALLEIIIGGGENTCQEFYEILKKQQNRYEYLNNFFSQGTQGSHGPLMFADGSSAITARKITDMKAKSMCMNVEISSSTGTSNQSGIEQTPRTDYTALNNSLICADVISGCVIDGPVNFSVKIQTPQVPAAKPTPMDNIPYSEVVDVRTLSANNLKQGPPEPTMKEHTASISDKLDFFKRNWSTLVSRVKNVDPIVDDLLSGNYHSEMAARVRAEDIPQNSMRKLLESTTSTGAADALFKALLKHEQHVMRDLMG